MRKDVHDSISPDRPLRPWFIDVPLLPALLRAAKGAQNFDPPCVVQHVVAKGAEATDAHCISYPARAPPSSMIQYNSFCINKPIYMLSQ